MNGSQEESHLQRKNLIKSLYIISWNVLDAFARPFLVLTTSVTLSLNRIHH